MIVLRYSVVLTLLLVSQVEALGQRTNASRLGVPGFGVSLELLARPDVRQELELVEDQQEQIESLRQKFRQDFRKAVIEMVPDENARERIRDIALRLNDDLRAELNDILLPHQAQRLAQLSFQFRLQGGPVAVFLSPQIAEELRFSEDQTRDLTAKSRDVERRYRQQLAALRRETQQQMLTLLTPAQQARFRELVGEPFEFQEVARPSEDSAETAASDPDTP